MESAENIYRSLEDEIQSVKELLTRKASGSEVNLAWECRVDPKADTTILVPGTLLRSFVEHALMSDILNHPDGGKIEVSVHRTTLGILVMITDNGSLRYREYSKDRLIGNRLELLDQEINDFNNEKKYTVSYQILDISYAQPGQTGTRVLITIVI
jgi:LytS/YehU family sensor histidine kinase